jgi:hypothetical protein
MTRLPKDAGIAVLERAFGPLTLLMLELGIGSKEAEVLLRKVFVQSAHRVLTDELGKQVSDSMVALRVGLHRKVIREHLRREGSGSERYADRFRLNRILAGWHEDSDFLATNARPAFLPLRGPKSFATLVHRYAPDAYPPTVLKELLRGGAVKRTTRGVRVTMRVFAAGNVQVDAIDAAGATAAEVLEALRLNAVRTPPPRVIRSAVAVDIDRQHLPRLKHLLSDRAAEFTQSIHEILGNDSLRVLGPGAESVRLGVAVVELGDADRQHGSQASGAQDSVVPPPVRARPGPRRRKRLKAR